VTAAGRDGGEIEALVTDRYLESLLTLGLDDPTPETLGEAIAARLQPQVRVASARLARDAPRYHPSFRFEERVALHLAEIAASMRFQQAAGGEGTVVPIRLAASSAGDALDPRDDLLFDGPLDERPDRVRPLLIGGALTSAALSLAGAAFVAWWRTRPATPMARAVRAVGRGRLA
jgi:hypothetical protein